MAYSQDAVRKGSFSEAIVKAYYVYLGYNVLEINTHETHWDFVIEKGKDFKRVQVKTCVMSGFKEGKGNTLIRIRNKRGQNTRYNRSDYDILVGVWVEGGKMYFFNSEDVNKEEIGETITVERLDGNPLTKTKAPSPYRVEEFSIGKNWADTH